MLPGSAECTAACAEPRMRSAKHGEPCERLSVSLCRTGTLRRPSLALSVYPGNDSQRLSVGPDRIVGQVPPIPIISQEVKDRGNLLPPLVTEAP
jgi:hypothetical protein